METDFKGVLPGVVVYMLEMMEKGQLFFDPAKVFFFFVRVSFIFYSFSSFLKVGSYQSCWRRLRRIALL